MKRKEYAFRYRLPETIIDVIPENRMIDQLAPMHCHDFYEIQVITSGTGMEILNDEPNTLRRGSITILAPSDFHSVEPHGELYFYNFMFRGTMLSPEILQSVWAFGGNKTLILEGEDLQAILSICQLLEWANHRQSDRAPFMKNIMDCFFRLLLSALREQQASPHKAKADLIQNSILYLHQHFQENPSLSDTAAAISWHPNYFSQRFREATGQTYTAYLTRLKLNYAKKLLLSSNLSVTEICFASGFTSLSNFMKVFKTQTGLSPLRYIESHHKDT